MLDAYFIYDTMQDRFPAQQIMSTTHGVQDVSRDAGAFAGTQPLDVATKARIDSDIAAADCLVVLIGQHTASDPRVIYAIGRAMHEFATPVIGVRIDKLADEDGFQGIAGDDPFTRSGLSGRALLQIETYDPPFTSSVFARSHIRFSMRDWIELAVKESVRRNSRMRRSRPPATSA